MPIYVVRHAHAIDGASDLPDEARWLTAEGRRAALAAGRRLAEERRIPSRIVTSPLVRAVQTAELVAQGLGWAGTVEVLVALSPDLPPSAAAALVTDGTLAVGHEPQVTMLARALGRTASGFRRGQVLEVSSGWTFG